MNVTDKSKYTLLYLAIIYDNITIIKMLLTN